MPKIILAIESKKIATGRTQTMQLVEDWSGWTAVADGSAWVIWAIGMHQFAGGNFLFLIAKTFLALIPCLWNIFPYCDYNSL